MSPLSTTRLFLTVLPFALTALAFDYPPAKSVDQTDTYHGTAIADPYRWLEDLDSPDTAAWVAAQNQVTFAHLATLPQRDSIKKRLLELLNYPRYSLPSKHGDLYFYTANSGLQNQSPLFAKKSHTDSGRLILDPNTLSPDGTTALTTIAPSEDARYLAYGTAQAGSDWNEFRILDLTTNKPAPDLIRWVKFSGLAWTHDHKGFFYSRFPEPAKDQNQVFSDLANQAVYYHRLGTPQSDDLLIYARPDQPKWGLHASLSEDGRYLLITLSEGTDTRNRLHYLDLKNPAQPDLAAPILRLIDTLEADYSVIGNLGSTLFLKTDLDAPRGKLIAIDLANPERPRWQTLVPESPDVLQSAAFIGQKFVLNYLQDAKSRLAVHDRTGAFLGEIALPTLGTVAGLSGRENDSELLFNFTSYTYPTTTFRTDLTTLETKLLLAPKVTFDPTAYETNQVFAASKDGTRIPIFITHRKGLKLDGANPTLLYGYGGFNITLQPSFSPSTFAWLELGGIYAVANLRGGGEYGKAWHEAGTKLKKQNVFDDFIAAGEFLIRENYTSSKKLILQGGSNGGLLVAAIVNQRPDLARVALPAVGVLDMLRFQKFTIGWAWTSDYGSSENPDEFKALLAYSPLHTLKASTTYPAIMVTTGDHDDRVHPGHSFKYIAALQALNPKNQYPILIRIDVKTGHGAGKPISKQIETTADLYAFALYHTAQ